MGSLRIDEVTVRRLLARTQAARWHVTVDAFTDALHASAAKAFAGETPSSSELRQYLESLHLEDLALACACAAGDDTAWEHFVLTLRPVLYRSADAIDATGNARELADSLYADLYGLSEKGGERQSLFRYFHGRSTLATWLRSVLAQRHVDRLRSGRRLESLPEEDDSVGVAATRPVAPDPSRDRYVTLVRDALTRAIGDLEPRDRLRLACYYAQDMTLAQIGRLVGEHEATVSRNLARVRRVVRDAVEQDLRSNAGLSDLEIEACFESVTEDAGPLDLDEMLVRQSHASESGPDRSIGKRGVRPHES
jgi:RNA polymerase sigma-70 factor, ECF subfamily